VLQSQPKRSKVTPMCGGQKAEALFLHAQLSAAVQRYARRGRSAARQDNLVRRRLERELEEARAYANMLLDRAQVPK
jgi:molecular chaperone GrpE (heat shock protein)